MVGCLGQPNGTKTTNHTTKGIRTMSDENQSMCAKPGRVSWNELITTDTNASADFYGKLFGWQATPFVPKGTPAGGPPYLVFKTDANDMGAGGMMQAPAPGIPSHWLPYVIVENVDTSLAKATSLGAKALTPVMAIGEVGRIAVIADPLGAVIGLHEPPK
jgi:predicted enzyme related to lactoylglutathione lyase